MKTRLTTLAWGAITALVASTATAFAQYDDTYITPKQNKTRQAELKKLDQERAKERARERELYLKQEAEKAYYNTPVDDRGFTDYEIDAYNRRDNNSYSPLSQQQKKQTKLAKRKRTAPKGKYADRLRRFHSDNAIVLVDAGQVYIISDDDYDSYYDEDSYYYGGSPSVNFYIYGGYSALNSYACSSYPWYDPWYSYWANPWYYSWRDPFYYYYRRPGWDWGWSMGWGYSPWYSGYDWGWNMGFGYSPWYSGYNWGYRDGFWDGYYWGSRDNYYDPYNGSYYSRPKNVYPNGRRSNKSYQGSYNNGQRDNDQYASSRSSSSIAARNQYARGSYWSDSKSRSTDNSFSNNYGGRRGTSNERGIFSRNELGQVTAGGSSYDRGTTSREVFRQPRRDLNPDLTAQEFNRGISSSTRNDYQGGRGVFRTDRSFNSSSTPTRSREVFRSDRPSRNDYQGGRGVFGTDRSSNSSSTPTRSREVFRSDRPSRNDYQGGRGVFGTDRSSSSSSSTYSPSRSSSPSSDRSYGGGSRNSTGRR